MPFHGLQGRKQWAVYWPRVGSDATGQPTTGDVARELRVRWDDARRTVTLPDGTPVGIDATAGGLEFEPPAGSLMWKGRLGDLPGTGQLPAADVMRVVTVNSTPDVRGRNAYREATLTRTKDVLGTTVTG